VEDYGFLSFNFLDIGQPNADVPFYLTTVSKDFEAAYRDNSFVAVDPYVSRARRTNTPFTWSGLVAPEYSGKRKPGVIRLYEAVRDFRYNEGYIVPFHFHDPLGRACSALILLIWADTVQKFRFLISERRYELHLICIYWAQRVIDVVAREHRGKGPQFHPADKSERSLLSDRERDVLTWAGRGKTVADTADILGISENTVEGYFKTIYSKLNVLNKTHAVAKAIYGDLIDI